MKTEKEKMPIVGFRMPKRYIAMLKEAAKKEDRSFGYIIRRIVIEWLEVYQKRGKRK